MCVICLAVKGTGIDKSIMQRMVSMNTHGWGFAARFDDGRIETKHGFGEKNAWRVWRDYANADRVFHARIATSGKINEANTHPFNATGPDGKERWLFHNGMVDIPRFDDDYSDTWHLALYLRQFPWDDKKFKESLAAYARHE